MEMSLTVFSNGFQESFLTLLALGRNKFVAEAISVDGQNKIFLNVRGTKRSENVPFASPPSWKLN